jgi:hypothetical protein
LIFKGERKLQCNIDVKKGMLRNEHMEYGEEWGKSSYIGPAASSVIRAGLKKTVHKIQKKCRINAIEVMHISQKVQKCHVQMCAPDWDRDPTVILSRPKKCAFDMNELTSHFDGNNRSWKVEERESLEDLGHVEKSVGMTRGRLTIAVLR